MCNTLSPFTDEKSEVQRWGEAPEAGVVSGPSHAFRHRLSRCGVHCPPGAGGGRGSELTECTASEHSETLPVPRLDSRVPAGSGVYPEGWQEGQEGCKDGRQRWGGGIQR